MRASASRQATEKTSELRHYQYVALLSAPKTRRTTLVALMSDAGPNVRQKVRFCPNASELVTTIRASPPALALVEYPRFDVDAAAIREIRRLLPSAGVVAVLTANRPEHAIELIRAGVEDFVLEAEIQPILLSQVVEVALTRPLVARVTARIRGTAPPQLARYISDLVLATRRPIPLEAAADVYGRSIDAVNSHLSIAGWPTLGRLVALCRLLHAAHLLENPNRSVEQVSEILQFPSRTALYNQLIRYVGIGPRQLRRGIGVNRVLEKLFESCRDI